ncbi:S41 family peptidase [Opitutales bacterium]|nr:S41 family peptidase [Opitutales bacterium]
MRLKKFFIWGIPSFVLSFLLCKVWLDPSKQSFFDSEYWNALFRFGESLRITNALYVDKNKSDYSQLTDIAISGMVTELDRHSSYYTPKQYTAFKDDTHRRYVGIGVMIRKVEEGVLVTRVFPGGPAEESGLSVGEYITKVEEEVLAGWELAEVSKRIKGEENTSVRITVRSRLGEMRGITVLRKKINISSVEGINVDQNGTAYIRLVQFTSRSGAEFKEAISDLKEKGMKRLILDLRDNSGGLLSAAIEITECFLSKGQLIVSIKGRKKNEVRDYYSNTEENLPDIPMVVLMNEGSASASEIVGGALSVLGRAPIIGEQSFGKGSVQTIFPMEDESGLRLTTAMYFLPDGSTIHEEGIEPQFKVDCSDENETKLRIQRYSQDIMTRETFEKQFGFTPIVDVQLGKAEEVLLLNGDEGTPLKQ